jgi:RNA polymerase sigma-70 factor (ECF subfamily)
MEAEQRRVLLLCHRILGDRDEAETAAQDVFLKAYRALVKPAAPELEDAGKWLTRITVNTCLDRLRSRRWQFWRQRARPDEEDQVLAKASTTQPNAEDRVFARQIQVRLDRAAALLSPRQRAAFALRHYEDRSLEEIAGILDLDVGTVKAHLARALTKLRKELHDLYGMRRHEGPALE